MAKNKNKAGSVVAHFWIYVLLILLAVLSILPFWVMFMNATRSTPEINANALGLWPSKYLARNWDVIGTKSFNAMTGFVNSMIISTGATVLSVYFSSMTAYSIVAYRWKLRRAFFTFIMAVLMIPSQIVSIGFYQMMYSFGMNNMSQVYIDYIELYYDTVEDITSEVQDELDSLDARVYALEQGGGGSGETVVASYTATAQTNVDAALNAIGQQLNALTLSEHEWSKLVLAMKYGATGEPTYARCCRVSNANFFFSFVDFINNNTMYQVSRTNSGSNFFINGTSMLQDYYISAGGGCTVYY